MTLHHRWDGPVGAPIVVLGPSLGTTLDLWEPQLLALTASWRLLRYDLPGHGGSAARSGTVEDFADAVAGLLDGAAAGPVAYCGVSMGGAIGTMLAVRRPELVGSLVICCSSAFFGNPDGWRDRAAAVRDGGLEPLTGMFLGRWFTPSFTETGGARAMLRSVDAEGYAACCEALAAFDARDRLGAVRAPTLVIAGEQDIATPIEHARALADGIPDAELVVVPDAAHLANVERPVPVTDAITAHLTATWRGRGDGAVRAPDGGGTGMTGEQRYAAGMKVRREVLGDAHVDRAEARKTDFTADFQDLITRYAWGEIWTRPGLDRRVRSCITLTALVAGGHLEELAMHVRAAVRNGLTSDEIREVLLQTAIYCGVPSANSAFSIAQRVLIEDGVITQGD